MKDLSEVNKVSKHFVWGDIAKGIAILSVIIGHTYPSDTPICKTVFLFHLPIFFFLAGYFMNFEKYKSDFIGLLKSTFKRILIPAFFTFLLFYNINLQDIFTLLYASGVPVPQTKITPIEYQMWFLFCLICVRMLLYGYLKFNENFKTNIILNIFLTSIISLIGVQIGQLYKLPWSFDIALVAFYIAYIGYLFKFYNIFDKIKYPLLLFLITILSSYIDYKYFGLSMNNRFYSSNPIISVNISILISVTLIYICILIEKKQNFCNKFLAYLGANSLIIMIFHTLTSRGNSYGSIICVFIRIIYCIVIIEFFALIPQLKSIYGAKSIKEFISK